MKMGFISALAFVLLITQGGFSVLPVHAATLVAGNLVKLPDDGNSATTADSAVYYYGADGLRYVFPSDKAFFTWYGNFDGVKVIDAATMASLRLGGNVTYRPGIRMVKIVSDPKVYAVAKNGTLRPIAGEAVASGLYGADWNTKIDDISDAFFINYTIGAEVASVAAFNPSSESLLSPTIGVDKSLGVVPQTFPTSDDEPNFTIEARGLPSKGPFVNGSSDVTFSIFALKASTTSVNTVTRLKFQGYVDEREGVSGFSAHVDNDDGTATFANTLVTQVGLYDASGAVIASPKSLDGNSMLEFTGLHIVIQPGQEFMVHLKGGVNTAIDHGTASDYFALDIADLPADVTVMNASGGAIHAVGTTPNGGISAAYYVEIVSSGTMTFTWKGVTGNVIAGREALIGTLEIAVTGEDFALEQLSLRTTGLLASVDRYRLSFLKSDDTMQEVTSPYLGNLTTISHLPFVLEHGRTNVIQVFAKLKSKNTTFYNERIRAEVLSTDPMIFRSPVNGTLYRETIFIMEPAMFKLSATTTDVYVRFSAMTFSMLSGSPSGPVGKTQATEILRFRITAEPESGIRVKHLTFKLVPGDTETSGGINDALEKWANINGDGADDNDLVNLYQISPQKDDPIGEDASARLTYSIVDDGVKDVTPSGIVSSAKDYGLVEYDFLQDQEIMVPAGTSVDFRLELDTSKFAIDSHTLKVSILGTSDIQWTDLYTGNYPIITSEIVAGLPLLGHDLTVQ